MRIEANLPGTGWAAVEVSGEAITGVEVLGAQRSGEPCLSAGLIDIQLNGYAGVNFSDPELDVDALVSVLPALAATGTLAFCPTFITNSTDALERNLAVFERARRASRELDRMVPCYHVEGPYLSPGASRGVHDPKWMHAPDWDEFCRLQRAAGGRIGILTVAPELPGAIEFIARVAGSGVIASIGHTDCLPEQIHAAAAAGARASTHLANGCPQTIDRHKSPVWAQLTDDRLTASIICDGFHLTPDVVKVIAGMKGLARLVLITDASHVAGLPPGRYSLVGCDIELLPDGKVIRADGGSLAGSALDMIRAVMLFVELSGRSLADALTAAAANPARLLGRAGLCREVAPGQPANLILFRGGRVEAAWLAGNEIYAQH